MQASNFGAIDDATARALGTQDDAAGEQPMTEAQTLLLRRLAQETLEPEAFSRQLTSAEARQRIEALRAKLRLQDGPPHVL
jgi:hypothetical protein